MNADVIGLTQLTSNAFKDYTPAWSPDGSTIAFASNTNDPNPATCVDLFGTCEIDIFVMPATGGSPVQVTFEAGTEQWPQFSPDGKFIAYNHSEGGGVSAIDTVDLDSRQPSSPQTAYGRVCRTTPPTEPRSRSITTSTPARRAPPIAGKTYS